MKHRMMGMSKGLGAGNRPFCPGNCKRSCCVVQEGSAAVGEDCRNSVGLRGQAMGGRERRKVLMSS